MRRTEDYVTEACHKAEELFRDGARQSGFVMYDYAVRTMHRCKTPLAFLASFVQVEHVRIRYVERRHDDF